MNRWSALAFLLALGLALGLRLPALDRRPLHNDEGVNAAKLAALLERGDYRYDPHEYHGPTLHYFSLAIVWLTGARDAAALSDSRLRLAPVLFGVGLILLLLPMRTDLGNFATGAAALLIAVSPAMVFYSRYFIHELLLVFFTLLALVAGWRYWQTRRLHWAMLGGAGLGLMWATKETFVFNLAAAGTAILGVWLWENSRGRQSRPAWPHRFHLTLLGLTALGVGAVLFTSFLKHPRGVADAVLTYEAWFHRAGGASPHIYPWHFYFERLLWFHPARGPWWTEGIIALLALAGGVSSFAGNRAVLPQPALGRFLTIYTVTLAAIYTLIPYKTPWCLLGFWSSAIILAGIGAATFWQSVASPRGRTVVLAILLAGLGHLGWQAWRAAHEFAADRRNPYVFAQTLPDARRLVDRVLGLARLHPAGVAMPVKVVLPVSEWPLPWYLRPLERVGWWSQPPADPLAPVVIADANLQLALDEKSGRQLLMAGLFELRPGVFVELYADLELWKQFVASRPPAP
jgi:uncharacterized protein (TIGR03663 family)